MHFLIIDGNSLINRAFYGIKMLTAKDGHFTNAIFGFTNMLLSLLDQTQPQAVAVAFDLKAPTFRHKMYEGYKAGRKAMPSELHEQMEPMKDLLRAFGCHIVECEGYEADDILGTLSAHTAPQDVCFIATGDRDSLQLIRSNVNVLLTTTKMGQTQTTRYDEAKLMEEYGLTPAEMIELKALQGDNSDNIPGVAGVGPKTAGELIKKYHSIDNIYEDLNALEVTNGVRAKLEAGKDSAFLSRTLGTICLEAPIDKDISAYLRNPVDPESLKRELAKHEMFKLIARLKLDEAPVKAPEQKKTSVLHAEKRDAFDADKNSTLYLDLDDNGTFYALYNDALYYIPNGLSVLKTALENENVSKVFADSKKAYKYAMQGGVEIRNVSFDLRLAAYLLNPNATGFSVAEIAMSYNIPLPEVETDDGITDESRKLLREIAAAKTLANRLTSILENNNQMDLLKDMEIPLAEVLSAMEEDGMEVNSDNIRQYSVILSQRIGELEHRIYDLAGEEFNINSPKQLGAILFEKLGLPAKKKTKTGWSTNAEVLEGLADDYPIVSDILEYRAYAKLKSTYCEGLLKAIGPDGRIHSTFNQTETRTGRLSSTEPNLQNIPVRTELGREFRKFFTARDGYVLVDADYSQIELRVLAALADDKNMLDCFNRGVDVHTVTAAKVFGIPEENVTPELRSKAKAVNFGIVYGIGSFSLAKDIHSTRAEAERFINAYLALYSSIDGYMKNAIASAKEKGYAETVFHRRRYLPELTSSNAMLRAFGERVARNMPIQGTAADIIKIAMVKIYRRLQNELPQVRLIMQVHDELILESPALLAQKAAELLKEEMENAVSLSVKLRADAGIGKTWYEAKA